MTKKERIKKLEGMIEKYHQQADEHFRKYLEAKAELENYKKRKDREVAKEKELANEEVLKDLLPIMDSLENAYLYMYGDKVDMKTVCENIDVVWAQLGDVLKKNGVKVFNSVGESFDPYKHEALGVLKTDRHEEGIVLDQMQRGYMLKDRLLRPATVMVSKRK